MGLPKHLILVRHGQSEGNEIQSKYKKQGFDELFTPEFLDRHESQYRLTEKGVIQAQSAGNWIAKNIPEKFDRMYVSGHIRAMETAAHLDLTGNWFIDMRLRERDGGLFNTISPKRRDTEYKDWAKHAKSQPFLWRPPEGESVADVAMRTKDILETICRECDGKNVISVCHGHVIRTFRIWLERLSFSCNDLCRGEGENAVHNCSIWHYTRENIEYPHVVEKYAGWMRVIDPTHNPVVEGEWKTITRPRFSNSQLLDEVNKIERL